MIPSFVRGSIAPVFTAFHEDGRFDPEGQRNILTYLHDAGGISAYFVRCGMGQMYTFSYEETQAMAKTACEHMAGKGPVLVGTAGIWDRDFNALPDPALFQQQAIELSQYAESVGAAGVVHTMPEAIAPKAGETHRDVILRYFEQVSASVKIPVFLYQPPSTIDAYRVNPDLLAELADMPNVVAIKVSTNDAEYIFNLTYAVRNKKAFGFISGAETAFLQGLISGSRAVIGQGATLNPKILNAIQTCYEKGDIEGAIEAQHITNLLVTRSKGTQEFFKRYIAEKGVAIKPFQRGQKGGALYATEAGSLSENEYAQYKKLFETELAKY